MKMKKLIYALLLDGDDNPDKLHALLTDTKGIFGMHLVSLPVEKITAIVSEIESQSLVADKTTAMEYASVIETLFQHCTLLPMRFGSLMESNDEIRRMVERNHQEILQNLHTVENKYEFGLKIFCDPESVMTELRKRLEASLHLKQISGAQIINSPSRDWIDKKLKEHRLEESLLTYIDSILEDVTIHLDNLKAERKIKKMVTPSMIIDGVILLDKRLKDVLVKMITDLQGKYPTLNFVLTGPWPPYNFVTLTVK